VSFIMLSLFEGFLSSLEDVFPAVAGKFWQRRGAHDEFWQRRRTHGEFWSRGTQTGGH
jgi:hypothetical protein